LDARLKVSSGTEIAVFMVEYNSVLPVAHPGTAGPNLLTNMTTTPGRRTYLHQTRCQELGRVWRGALVRRVLACSIPWPTPDRRGVPGSGGRVKGRAERGRVSDAVGALEAVGGAQRIARPRGWPVQAGNVNVRRCEDHPLHVEWGCVAAVGGGVWAGGSQTYLWPSGGLRVPGDRMMDWLTPRGGCGRSVSLGRPRRRRLPGGDTV
jgi:hypothetical protein